MIAIITKQNTDKSYDNVGMNNRYLIRSNKLNTVLKNAPLNARIELFTEHNFYTSEPFKTIIKKC